MDHTLNAIPAVDIAIGLVVLASLLMGLWRGLIYEALALINWVQAFVIANLLADIVASWIGLASTLSGLRYFIGFALVFVLALLIGGWIASWIRSWVAQSRLRAADRSLGGLFGLTRAVLLLWVVAFVVAGLNWRASELWSQSHATPWLDQAVDWVKVRGELPAALKKE
jgi:membrane protein required for colicin V production